MQEPPLRPASAVPSGISREGGRGLRTADPVRPRTAMGRHGHVGGTGRVGGRERSANSDGPHGQADENLNKVWYFCNPTRLCDPQPRARPCGM